MLPPLPSFLPAKPTDIQPPDLTIYPEPDPSLTSTPGAGPSTLCSICSSTPKYTCPRCSARSCSLPCSKAHKAQTGCSGIRDPARFVTLSEFGQGDWGGDYAYLESGRRKIADWGKDLPPSDPGPGSRAGQGGGYQRRHQQQGGKKRGLPKLEGLRREMESRGIEVEFMPEGMGKRKLNQSTWNPKTQKLHMTVQLSIPEALLANAEAGGDTKSSNTNTSHGTGTAGTKTINHLRVLFSDPSPSEPLPTLQSLLPPLTMSLHVDEVVLLLPFHPSVDNPTPIDILLRQPRPKLFFPPLDPEVPLEVAFKGMSWVEYPVVQVVKRVEWQMMEKEGRVAVVPVQIPQGVVRGEKRGLAEASTDIDMNREGEVKRVRSVPIGPGPGKDGPSGSGGAIGGGGLMALGGYESDGSEEEAGSEGAGEGEGEEEVEEMIVTEEDVRVLHALGRAAAADMA